MARYTYKRFDSGEINVKKLFKPGVTDQKLRFILKNKCWSQYKEIVDPEKIMSIPLKKLDSKVKKLEKRELVGDYFKATMSELRRSEKAKKASEKHAGNQECQTASLEIDIKRDVCERDALKQELEDLRKEIYEYKQFMFSYFYNQDTIDSKYSDSSCLLYRIR